MRRSWMTLLALIALLALVGGSEAQTYRAWPNDQLGRPAPPCMIVDPATGITSPCTATNPIPVSGGGGSGAGQGTTSGTSTTGFGKGWYPVNTAIASGRVVSVYQPGGLTVNTFRRVVGCGNCLAVATSTDGGVTFIEFNTSFIAGNEIQFIIRVPTTVPRYLAYVANGAGSHIFSSTALLSGWADSTTASAFLNNSIISFASNANGSTVLSSAGTGGGNPTEVCRSTNGGVAFPTCVNAYAAVPAGDVFYAGGSNWLVMNTNGDIARSTNDGVSWTNITNLAGGAGGGFHGVCLANASPAYGVCLASSNGTVYRSTDNGLTWISVLSTGTTVGGFCDYGAGSVGIWSTAPPVGFATIATNVWSSQDFGATIYAGAIYGSGWNGVGTEGFSTFTCNTTGRGFAGTFGTGGTFLFYNPLTQPGGTLTSSAGGYNVSALIQSGVILNAAPVTSAANTAAAVTLTGTSGSRVCIREIDVESSAAATATLTVTDGATVVLNYGTLTTGVAPNRFNGSPLLCGQTGNTLTVNIGAAGVGITTTTSVIADRYPN
jgi:hypothetical protein